MYTKSIGIVNGPLKMNVQESEVVSYNPDNSEHFEDIELTHVRFSGEDFKVTNEFCKKYCLQGEGELILQENEVDPDGVETKLAVEDPPLFKT